MSEKHFTYLSADRLTQIHAIAWEPAGEVKAILQIAHGMQEFIDRYADFAAYLNTHGFLVVGNDHLGHGGSVRSQERMGYFAAHNGNKAVIADMRSLHRQISEAYPGIPYFLLGHSMGSFLARQYLCMYGQFLDGAVISGTAYHPYVEATMGAALCKVLAKVKGWEHRSTFINGMAIGSYNKRFEPARTKVDWLTRDEKIVDAYREDPRTQPIFTLNAYYNMFIGLQYIARRANLAHIPHSLPVLFIAGEMDPVGSFGAGVKRAFVQLKALGLTDVSCKLYPNDRHEVLNELDRAQVYEDVLTWLEAHTR